MFYYPDYYNNYYKKYSGHRLPNHLTIHALEHIQNDDDKPPTSMMMINHLLQ